MNKLRKWVLGLALGASALGSILSTNLEKPRLLDNYVLTKNMKSGSVMVGKTIPHYANPLPESYDPHDPSIGRPLPTWLAVCIMDDSNGDGKVDYLVDRNNVGHYRTNATNLAQFAKADTFLKDLVTESERTPCSREDNFPEAGLQMKYWFGRNVRYQ